MKAAERRRKRQQAADRRRRRAAGQKLQRAAEEKRRQDAALWPAKRRERRAAGVCVHCAGPLQPDDRAECEACFWGDLEDSPDRRRVKNRRDWNCAVCGCVLARGKTTWRLTLYGRRGGFRVWAKKHAVCGACYGSIAFRKPNVAEAEADPDPAAGRGRPKKRRKQRPPASPAP